MRHDRVSLPHRPRRPVSLHQELHAAGAVPRLQPLQGAQYPLCKIIKELGAQGKLTDWQKNFYLSPTMPEEELYDMDADPWSMKNLVKSDKPQDQAELKKLRAALENGSSTVTTRGVSSSPPKWPPGKVRRRGRTGREPKKGKGKKKAP